MKRVFAIIIALFMLVSILPIAGNATETVETVYFDDGSYMIIEINYSPARETWSITGKKQYTYYDSNSISQWKAVLTGTFSYTGTSSSCTSSNVDVSINDSDWYVISKSASKSGNKATGSATIGEKVLGVTVTKVPVSLSLECDADGNLS